MHSSSNNDDTPSINTDSNSSANVATEDDKVSRASSNNEVESEVSGQTTTLSDTTVPLDPKIELNLSKEQLRQNLVEQVQSELARAQENMEDKSETPVTETQASSSTALDDSESQKTSVKPTESNTEIGIDNGNEGQDHAQAKTPDKSTESQEEKLDRDNNVKQQDTESRKESSGATSENSNSDQDKNSKPNANAGHKHGVKEGSRVVLDGTNSKDKDGDKMSYSWKQVQGPKVKLGHGDDAVVSFEAPNVPSGKNQLELQFSLTVTDGDNTDKDTVSVSVRQDGSQDSKVNDEKARKSANDEQKSSDDKADRDRDQDSTESSKKSDGDDQKSEKNNDDNANPKDSEKSEDKSKSQDTNNNNDSDEEKSDKSKDKEENSSGDDGKSDNSNDEEDGAS